MLILVISAYGIIGDLIYTVLHFNFPCSEQNTLSNSGKEITKKTHTYTNFTEVRVTEQKKDYQNTV